MTVRNAGLITAGVVAAFVVGVLSGPTIHHSWSSMSASAPTAVASRSPSPAAAPAPTEPARSARPSSARAHEGVAASNGVRTVPVSVWQPQLRDRVKAVLNPGTHLDIAAENFGDAVQFLTVAHAAHDTQIPFMVLKDRVLNHSESLAAAIHQYNPGLDAKAEVARAKAEARSDLQVTS